MKENCAFLAGLAALGSACTMREPVTTAPPAAAEAATATQRADIRDRTGRSIGRAVVTQVGDSLRVQVEATNMRAGTYGAHIHAVGRCDTPDYTSAGPHWNPTGQQHGKNNPQGMHKGDLPNLFVGADGRGSIEINVPRGWVMGGDAPLLDADGAAIVVHERPDDYRTEPSGNSGARIACGVIS